MHRRDMAKASLAAVAAASIAAPNRAAAADDAVSLASWGNFHVGGRLVEISGKPMREVVFSPGGVPAKLDPNGTYMTGGMYAQYMIPSRQRGAAPLLLWHGGGLTGVCWETTPDGREGFQNIFLRRRFPVYLIDQPRRGNAGRATVSATVAETPDEQAWFDTFRVGTWPDYFPGVQFSHDPQVLNQFFRQMTPNVGPYDAEVNTDAFAALFDRIGPAIFVTHSQGGGQGWLTVLKTSNIKGIVAYEPGSGFLFPEGEVPADLPSAGGTLGAIGIPLAQFEKLTKIPIVIYYGDNIADKPTDLPGPDGWRVRLEMARKWQETVNRHGGHVTLVHLPEIGIRGNTHFPFSDLNNVQIADLMSRFLTDNKLDR